MSRRAKVKVYSRTIVTDETAQADAIFTGRKIRHLGPPWVLSVATSNATTTAPTTVLSFVCTVQNGPDGTTWTAVPGGLTNTAIAASGAQTATKGNANQWDEYVRVIQTSASQTWGGGTLLEAWIIGETRAT